MSRKLTTEDFIQKAKQIHGNEYDYSQVDYVNSHTKVCIVCKIHGHFYQRPNDHLTGYACIKCANNIYDTNKFITEATIVHDDLYDYHNVNISGITKPVTICCKLHGNFNQIPFVHLRGSGCPTCKNVKKLTTEDFIAKANIVHNNKYDYSHTCYISATHTITICCPVHGDFHQKASCHLQGDGCAACNGNKRLSTEEFISKAKKIHGEKYDYSLVDYKNTTTKIQLICPDHGIFKQKPANHLQGTNCPKCVKNSHSLMCINWLSKVSEHESIYIQHALNGGEYHIPGTRYKADGYCKETNTIYEFYGDYWHGNPSKYSPTNICFSNIAADTLYKKTIDREDKIKKLGYNLITMWENDWKNS